MNRDELLNYYISQAEHSKLPLMVHNAPEYTSTGVDPELLKYFLKHPNIVGIKDSSGSISYIHKLLQARGKEI